jgi:hypothetical protein
LLAGVTRQIMESSEATMLGDHALAERAVDALTIAMKDIVSLEHRILLMERIEALCALHKVKTARDVVSGGGTSRDENIATATSATAISVAPSVVYNNSCRAPSKTAKGTCRNRRDKCQFTAHAVWRGEDAVACGKHPAKLVRFCHDPKCHA